ncbi:MAG: YceI family protein [Phycisphaeraceae bacterium]|nr:YceI family protein [Phycisphaeraceae bacterium]
MTNQPLPTCIIRTATAKLRRHPALVATALLGTAAVAVAGAMASSSLRSTTIAAVVPAVTAAPAHAAAVETFKVDTGHSTALFRVQHLGVAYFWGRFDTVTGTIKSDSASADGLSFDITIDVNSVNTASTPRDNHLRAPDFFSAREFPTMTFKSTSAKKVDGNFYDVTGDLTMRGVTKPITARVEWTGTGDKGMGRRIGFEATFNIKRSEFGVSYGVENGALGDDVRVIVALEGILEQ